MDDYFYFSYINIFTCRFYLIDTYNEYKLNYNEGNTLELDIQDKWNMEVIDVVIGNTYYNSSKNTNIGIK